MDTKTCCRCKKPKPLDAFTRHKDTKDGLQGSCKVCNKQAIRNRRKMKGGTTMEMAGTKKFSTERYCESCEQTKDWKSYYAEQGMCKMCWRAFLTREPVEPRGPKKKNTNMQDLLDFLDRVGS